MRTRASLVIGYQVIQRRQPYQDLGSAYFDERQKSSVVNRLTRRLENLGYTVSIMAPATACAKRYYLPSRAPLLSRLTILELFGIIVR